MSNIILKRIKKKESLNKEEEVFLEQYTNFFIENNNFLALNIKEDKEYEDLININDLKIHKKVKKIEHIEQAASLFIKYLKNKNRIIILTDNDLDGTSARSIASSIDLYLKRKYKYEHIYETYFTYGRTHGITFEQVDNLLNSSQDEVLIVTADNGINNKKEIEEINKKYPNVNIIITDHHIANKEDGVFKDVDYVINPEAIDFDKKSEFLNISVNNKEGISSYSGGHVFYLLMKEILLQLKISNTELNQEIFNIALFSNIGDIINYDIDIVKDLHDNKRKMLSVFLLKNHLKNLDFFNKFPEEKYTYKINFYISKVISILNSSRRLNSILKQFHTTSKESFKEWFIQWFDLDIDNNYINDVTLFEYLQDLNEQSKKVYHYFNGKNEYIENNIIYSYIKEMPVLLLMTDNSQKTDTDKMYYEEAYLILDKLNKFKNYLKKYIVDNDLYTTYKNDLFEIFYSKKGIYLREILSIQAFIEVDKRKSFMTLAESINEDTGYKMVNGSMRSKEYLSFKKLFLDKDNKEMQNIINKYNININIYGHDLAAGIFLYNKEEDFTIDKSIEFFKEIYESLEKSNLKTPDYNINKLDIKSLKNIDAGKMLRIFSKYMYVSPHPHWKDIKYHIEYKDLKEEFGNIPLRIASSGKKYFNIKDKKENTFLYFEQKENDNINDKVLETDLNIKYNSKKSIYFFEMILNPL